MGNRRKGAALFEEVVIATVLRSALDWLGDFLRVRRGIRVQVAEERGPMSRQFGFTEKAVKVTIRNKRATRVEIQDIRLMFRGVYGVPVRPEAPPPRSHSALPVVLDPGSAKSWYFPAEKLAGLIGWLSSKPVHAQSRARLRPRVTTASGRVYRGPVQRFCLDVNSHWP